MRASYAAPVWIVFFDPMILIPLTWIIAALIFPESNHFWIIVVFDRRGQIDRLFTEVEREAYARGWRDAIAALQAEAPDLPDTESSQPDIHSKEASQATPARERPRGRPPKIIGLVREIVLTMPGMTGVEVVRSLERQGTPVIERTVRSCLRRLRDNRTIWQRKGRWYPKDNTTENAKGEAA